MSITTNLFGANQIAGLGMTLGANSGPGAAIF
ncbi:hypothetical protein JOH52_002402 [Sinorhizobium meliloti]|uniref:Uncharacterized protein n=1 Tax=Sinorhizobium meliloti (strain SM11) TaxID=707241 RepID=F7X223_SINMM|nr:hypothetical protein SM11_chr0910 [Sinorhizobium meliloti SM11]MBP2466381.1 hypothetical protein [Sinorhizobium meliloti]